jgi:2-polyprenyl-3-methyl-5-hydroxy-6-metoxy-1,4-benzoquinol methylase
MIRLPTGVDFEKTTTGRRAHMARVSILGLPNGRSRIVVDGTDEYVHMREWETSYPRWLIERVLDLKGPAWVCDEIARDESSEYTAAALKWALLSYLGEDRFAGARILDFGCGAGASTVALCKMFPTAHVVGTELETNVLDLARARANFYGLRNVEFRPSGVELPEDRRLRLHRHVGVFEHLLPERTALMFVRSMVRPGGVLFLRETPHRYFPLETHTTGLPLINYLPRRLALAVARRFGRGDNAQVTWDELLRSGIRGGSIGEIRKLLPEAVVLRPSRQGMEDLIDLWYASVPKWRSASAKRYIRTIAKALSSSVWNVRRI